MRTRQSAGIGTFGQRRPVGHCCDRARGGSGRRSAARDGSAILSEVGPSGEVRKWSGVGQAEQDEAGQGFLADRHLSDEEEVVAEVRSLGGHSGLVESRRSWWCRGDIAVVVARWRLVGRGRRS